MINPQGGHSVTEARLHSVIAICGIDGHAYGSWTTKAPSEMWLRDFLGEDFPRFRTMVYGYNSKLSGHAGGSLEQYTQRFLEDLKDVRATDEVA